MTETSTDDYATAWTDGMAVWLALQLDSHRTPRDLVRNFKPDASDDEADFLLWEQTCFPLGTIAQWAGQLRDAVSSVKADS